MNTQARVKHIHLSGDIFPTISAFIYTYIDVYISKNFLFFFYLTKEGDELYVTDMCQYFRILVQYEYVCVSVFVCACENLNLPLSKRQHMKKMWAVPTKQMKKLALFTLQLQIHFDILTPNCTRIFFFTSARNLAILIFVNSIKMLISIIVILLSKKYLILMIIRLN